MKVLVRILSILVISYFVSFLFLKTTIDVINSLLLICYVVGVELFCMLLYFTVISYMKLDIKTRRLILLFKGIIYYIYLVVLYLYLKSIKVEIINELIKYSILTSLFIVLITSYFMYIIGERITNINKDLN